MTMTTSMQRSQIVIPAQGLIEIRDTLTDLLKEFGTEDNGEMLLHTSTVHIFKLLPRLFTEVVSTVLNDIGNVLKLGIC